jgi:hypothetical protein
MIRLRSRARVAGVVAVAALTLAGCETTGTGSPGLGTVGGAVAGAGVGNLFGNSTSGILIGSAVGGLAGNMLLDRPAEQRRAQEAEVAADTRADRELDLERRRAVQEIEIERQRALQEEETRRQIEEQRLFDEWRRERYGA